MDNAINDVLWEVPHIKLVRAKSGAYCLIVEDTELNDFVEDYLWDDFEFQTTTVRIEEGTTLAIYYNCFDETIEIEKVIEMLRHIDLNEVERIYKLSN
jgi:hypothetical protein